MVRIKDLNRGDLLRVASGVRVPLGNITHEDGEYSAPEGESETELEPGSPVVFICPLASQDDSLIILADGMLGWVFTDEVEPCQ
jgi:hypothetical protein